MRTEREYRWGVERKRENEIGQTRDGEREETESLEMRER